MPQPLSLAVVTPSFNTSKYLGAAIQSVLDQDWPDVDYIVMDGGSTDDSPAVLRSFGDRLKWVCEKDKGQSDAINKGFARTRGDILAWLNSDDTYAPGAFRAVMEYFQAHPEVDVVYGNADYIDCHGNLISPCVHIEPFNRRRLFRYSDFIVQPATFFRRSAFEAVGGIDTNLHWCMDYDLWLKIAQKHTIAYLPQLLAHFRWLKENKTSTGEFGRLDEITRVLARQGYGQPAYIRLERVNLHMQRFLQGIRSGKVGSALSNLLHAGSVFLSSPRAIASMCQPHTWRIIYAGQVLRARAARVQDL